MNAGRPAVDHGDWEASADESASVATPVLLGPWEQDSTGWHFKQRYLKPSRETKETVLGCRGSLVMVVCSCSESTILLDFRTGDEGGPLLHSGALRGILSGET